MYLKYIIWILHKQRQVTHVYIKSFINSYNYVYVYDISPFM